MVLEPLDAYDIDVVTGFDFSLSLVVVKIILMPISGSLALFS